MGTRDGSYRSDRFGRWSDAGWRDRILPTLSASQDPYLFRERFMELAVDIPADEREDAWELLEFSRRVTSQSLTGWGTSSSRYIHTPEIGRLLDEIEIRSSGRLATGLERLGGDLQRFATYAMMEEAIAEFVEDEGEGSVSSLRKFLHTNRRPGTPLEQKVLNFYRAMADVPELAKKPLTMDTVFAVQRTLAEGLVPPGEEVVFRTRNIPARAAVDEWPEPVTPPLARDVERVASSILSRTADEDHWVHPIIRGMMIYFSFLNLRPFTVNNVGLSRTLLQVYLHRKSYDAFQLMPVATVLLHRYREYGRAWPGVIDGDITGFITWALGSVLEALKTLERWVDDRIAANDRLREQLRFDPTLNHRQRTILGRAIRLPDAEFFIDYHRRSYDLSYSTARADLIGLVDRGYLTVERRGHAFVFTAVPSLTQIVGERTRVAHS